MMPDRVASQRLIAIFNCIFLSNLCRSMDPDRASLGLYVHEKSLSTLVNVYVDLVVFTRIAGTS